jgi:hypothetical protein
VAASQLVIHQNEDVTERVRVTLHKALGKEADCQFGSNFEVAWKAVSDRNKNWSLVVLGSNVPDSATTPVNPTESKAAREFIKRLRRDRDGRNIPIIALSTSDDELLGDLLRTWEYGELVKYQYDELAETAKEMHFGRRPVSRVELRILMHDSDDGRWDIDRKGKGSHGDVLFVPQRAFTELAEKSEKIGEPGVDWPQLLQEVSEKLYSVIFDGGNTKLKDDFFKDLEEVGGAENARIVFTLTPARQRAMVEALRAKQENADFWMMQTPIVRQYDSAGVIPPLFADEQSRLEPVNCLIISADSSKGVIDLPKWSGNFERLPKIQEEAKALEQYLKGLPAAAKIGVVDWLNLEGNRDDPHEDVLKKLKERTWHIIHFAGHGLVDRRKVDAGLLLNATAELQSVLEFDEFVKELGETRLLFVSSCRSASSEFISCAIRYTIPAVIGFRWPVDDDGASDFAQSFYRHLFTRGTAAYRSLDYSFLQARKESRERSKQQLTWASSMLLTQKQQ